MKILIVCGAGSVYGKELVTLSLMKGLRDRGHEVSCLASTWGDMAFTRLLEENSIPYVRIPLGFISKTLSWSAVLMTLDQMRKLPALWLGYRRSLKKFRADIIVHSNFQHIFLLWPLLGGTVNVFHVHDFFSPTRFYRFILRLLELRLCLVVGVSRFIADSLVGLGIQEQKVKYILNGLRVDGERERNLSERVGHEDNDFPENPISIGIVGQVGEWKGHDDLVDALQILRRDVKAFVCRIYGNGNTDYVDRLKEKIDRYQLVDDVQWVGFVEGTSAIYRNIDICVVPSRSQDPCPTVALEAGHFGIPAIGTRRGGLPEIIRDGETGYLVDAASPDQIAEKLRHLIQNREMRLAMGQAARRHAMRHLTSERMIEEMESLFYSVLESKEFFTLSSTP